MTEVDTIICGDCVEVMRGMDAGSVNCCVTSPPYWALRDYGVAGQLGLEETPEEYVAKMVEVFGEVKRVLRDDGTLWLNMGDSYASSGCGGGSPVDDRKPEYGRKGFDGDKVRGRKDGTEKRNTAVSGLKPKDLCGIPWRLALALQADGWYLRQDIIWHKPNPMPESATDRCTKSHEYIFLLTKKSRYYYDADAIKEKTSGTAHARGNGINPKAKWKTPDGWDTSKGEGGHGQFHKNGREAGHTDYKYKVKQNESFSGAVNGLVDRRNKRSVWTVPIAPYSEAHFATFPPDLILPCILAGCPQQVCVKCREPRRRVTETEQIKRRRKTPTTRPCDNRPPSANAVAGVETKTIGWTDCGCGAGQESLMTVNIDVRNVPLDVMGVRS